MTVRAKRGLTDRVATARQAVGSELRMVLDYLGLDDEHEGSVATILSRLNEIDARGIGAVPTAGDITRAEVCQKLRLLEARVDNVNDTQSFELRRLKLLLDVYKAELSVANSSPASSDSGYDKQMRNSDLDTFATNAKRH